MIESDEVIPDNVEAGFLDISANALAVIIFATMISLIVGSSPVVRGEIAAQSPPDLSFPVPLDQPLPPLTAFEVVTAVGLTSLDLDTMIEADGPSDQGLFSLRVERMAYRDLDEYQATVTLDLAKLRASAVPFDDQAPLNLLVAKFHEDFDRHNIAPTFLLSRDGISTFPRLYWALRKAGVPLRWQVLGDTGEIRMLRNLSMFETRARRWQ
jgi:hypothetical protein